MIRNSIRAATVALAALAIPAAILAAPLPASASSSRLCETSGAYCIGSANLNLYTAVTESNPGRNIVAEPQGGMFEGLPTYLLAFSADPSKCVAAANNGVDVSIHPCNGGFGVIWALQVNSNGHLQWLNRAASPPGDPAYLAGLNNGSGYMVSAPGVSHTFYNFDFK